MKPLKKIALVAILSTFLTACMSTQQINAEASQGYRQMKQQNAKAIDTSSVTAQRVHKIFILTEKFTGRRIPTLG